MTHENTNSAENITATALNADLLGWQQRLDRLDTEADTLAGTNVWPEWYYEGAVTTSQLTHELKAGKGEPGVIGLYYQLTDKEANLRSTITGRPKYDHSLAQVLYSLGDEIVSRGLKEEGEDGVLHQAIVEDIEYKLERDGSLTNELRTLQHLYGTDTLTDLLAVTGDPFADKIRTLLRHENAISWIRYNEDQGRSGDLEYDERKEASREWIASAIVALNGMTKEEASNYAFSASRRGNDEEILKLINVFDHFGADRISRISKATGIYGLETYSIAELERMEEYATDPKAVAEKLKDNDVVVVLTNRFGDYSGVMRGTAEAFDDSTGRVLYFEINHMDDIYRRMIDLHHAGIKPSTLVLSAHSSPGRFIVADDRKPSEKRLDIATMGSRRLIHKFNAGSERIKDDEVAWGFSMHGMKGMARLVDEYMQPSRSIDDDEADLGRKRIIFQGCDMGTESPKKDINEAGEIYEDGKESVIGQLAKDLVNSGVGSSIDIYGAPSVMQLHRTENGVRYSGPPNFEVDAMKRTRLDAVRMRVEKGVSTQAVVEEIALRKAA